MAWRGVPLLGDVTVAGSQGLPAGVQWSAGRLEEIEASWSALDHPTPEGPLGAGTDCELLANLVFSDRELGRLDGRPRGVRAARAFPAPTTIATAPTTNAATTAPNTTATHDTAAFGLLSDIATPFVPWPSCVHTSGRPSPESYGERYERRGSELLQARGSSPIRPSA